ncbi:MAG TPA: Tat pathway signal protein, partial [Candidatus Paceibacterota bacterium]|nr:Tat pathway signal protein [Candidatus Paceibacterota bacterium]
MRLHLLIASATVLCASHATARPATTPGPAVNLAVVATPTSSYVSGDTRESALNDESSPRSSRGDRRGTYGNWPRQGTQWVQYDWTQPISTVQIEVYWWDDARGVRLPKASRLKYWDGKDFIP